MAKEKRASIAPAFIDSISDASQPIVAANLIEENVAVKPYLVREAFGNFRRGSVLTDPELIQKVLASPQARFVIPMENN